MVERLAAGPLAGRKDCSARGDALAIEPFAPGRCLVEGPLSSRIGGAGDATRFRFPKEGE